MYLGFSQLNAPKPALLLGVSEKCASKVSKSGVTALDIFARSVVVDGDVKIPQMELNVRNLLTRSISDNLRIPGFNVAI